MILEFVFIAGTLAVQLKRFPRLTVNYEDVNTNLFLKLK